MNFWLWAIIALLFLLLIVLQVVGVRALTSWGVAPSKGVIALRTVNMLIVFAVLVFAFWKAAH